MSVLSNLRPLAWNEALNILAVYCSDYAIAQ